MTQPRCIVHIIDSQGVWGAETMLIELASQQIQAGDKVVVLSFRGAHEQSRPIDQALKEHQIPFKSVVISTLPRPKQLKILAETVNNYQADIVHSHGYKGNILFAFILRRSVSAAVVCTLHGWVSLPSELSKLRFYEWLDSWAIRRLNGVVVVSEAMLEKPALRSLGTVARVIDNGISTQVPDRNLPFEEQLRRFAGDRRIVASIGRLTVEKNFSCLLDSFAELNKQYPDTVLVIVGDGDCRDELDARITQLSLTDKVWITGYVEKAGASSDQFTVYVCSSLTEGLPMTLLEAMRAEVPIVSTAISRIPQLLQDGECGVLVESDNAAALASGIGAVLADEENARTLAINAKQRFDKHYSSEQMYQRYNECYNELVKVKG